MSGAQSWVLDYLLNAAWQVPLLFATAWVAAKLLRGAGAAVEHRIWATALVLETVLPAFDLVPWLSGVIAGLESRLFTVAEPGGARVTVTIGSSYVRGHVHGSPMMWTVVGCLYAAVVAYFAVRLVIALYRTAALRRGAEPTILQAESCRRLAQIFGVREPVIATSAKVSSPVTLGVWRHMILLPEAMDMELPREDMEAALAHEFAHIARSDFAKNLVHEVLSLPVAFHPLLWLTRRRVAESRERVCDALAAEVVEGRQRYARSLLRLASEFATRTPAVSTHAIGIFDANTFRNFERRVMSLTEKRVEMQGARRTALIVLSVVMGTGVCASAMALRMQVAGTQAAPTFRTVATVQTTSPTAPDHIIVAVPHSANAAVPKVMKVEVSPVQIAEAPTEPISGLKVVTLPEQAETQPHPQVDAMKQQRELSSARPVPSEVMATQILSKPQPVYPPDAKAAKISGVVVLKAVIGKDGKMQALTVLDGPKELIPSAMDSVRQWVYKPYLLNGEPQEVETTITVNFSLAN